MSTSGVRERLVEPSLRAHERVVRAAWAVGVNAEREAPKRASCFVGAARKRDVELARPARPLGVRAHRDLVRRLLERAHGVGERTARRGLVEPRLEPSIQSSHVLGERPPKARLDPIDARVTFSKLAPPPTVLRRRYP